MSDPTEGTSQAGLGRRFVVGSLYLSVGGWLTSAFNFVIGLVIARLLGPEALGFYVLMFSMNAVISGIGAFSPGLAVIQAAEESDSLYDTAVLIALGLALGGLVITLALLPWVVSSYSITAGWFLLWFGLARFFSFTRQVPQARLERHLRYRAVATINLVSTNVPNLVALGLAWLGAGAWSLLARDVLMPALGLALVVAASGYRFHRRVDRPTASRIMAFGRPMFVARSLELAVDRVDRLLIGGFLGDIALGFYHQSRFVAEAGWTATRQLGGLSFNLYSRLQNDPDRLRRAYQIVNFFLVRATLAGVVVLLVYPEQTLRLLLGRDWVPAAPLLRWLAAYGGLLPVFENIKQLLFGRGEVRAAVVLRVTQLGILTAGVLVAIERGEPRLAAAAVTVAYAASILLAAMLYGPLIARGLGEVLGAPLACAAVVVAGLVLGADRVASLPWWALPALPALLYGTLIAAIDHRKLVEHTAYLRAIVLTDR